MNRKHLRSLAAVQRGKKNIRSMEEEVEIFGSYPLEELHLEVAAEMAVKHKPFVDDIHNNDVAKTYPKSDCLPVGFADEVIAKDKSSSEDKGG